MNHYNLWAKGMFGNANLHFPTDILHLYINNWLKTILFWLKYLRD